MGRDDNKRVPGLQGGRAPARAFSAYMRYAVKDRPKEDFDFKADRPEWQLEPDEEMMFGDPDDYFFIDENGNLIEPGLRDPEGIENIDPQRPEGNDAPPAVSEDFLDEALGGSSPASRPNGDDRPTPPPPPRREQPVPVPPREQTQLEDADGLFP